MASQVFYAEKFLVLKILLFTLGKSSMSVSPKTQLDIPEVWKVYREKDNYKIYDFNNTGNQCILYFSSNGIYFPDTAEAFTKAIIQQDRYEWRKSALGSAKRIIFIRDVLKTWYLKGINSKLNTVEKTLKLLERHTDGLDVTCVGNSAGGYAAVLFGVLLKARRVFSFSGQFSLHFYLQNELERSQNKLLVEYENVPEISQYYSLLKLIESSKTPIFYFYPLGSIIDSKQAAHVSSLSNVHRYAFNKAEHATTCFPINFTDLLEASNAELIDLHSKYKNRAIRSLQFSLAVSGYSKTSKYLVKRLMKR